MGRIIITILVVILLHPLATFSILFWNHIQDHVHVKQTKSDHSLPGDIDIETTSSHSSQSHTAGEWRCEDVEGACADKLGYEAIRTLHAQLDDDANGCIDVAESDDFLRDELKYENGYDRQNAFHRNDKYISVDELWLLWMSSEVRNWTTEEVIEWVSTSVDLPQYAAIFENKKIDGTYLPRLAVNAQNLMSAILAIKDPIHRQKLALKAMDVVLFGPNQHRNYLKDVILMVCVVAAFGGCWFAFVQYRYSQDHLRRMMKDMESLQNAEDALKELQMELDKAKQEQEIVAIEKENLERRLQTEMAVGKGDGSFHDGADPRVPQLERRLQEARAELARAERLLATRSWAAPVELQRWLQITHELELQHYNMKKLSAERQLAAAKEGCEKLRRKRSSLMEAFRIAHGSSIDDIDHQILQAKAALCEVTKDLQERMVRWKKIESLCGFPIVQNPGLGTLMEHSTKNGTGPRVSPPPSYTKFNSHTEEMEETEEDSPQEEEWEQPASPPDNIDSSPTPPQRRILRTAASHQDFSRSADMTLPKLNHSESCTEVRKVQEPPPPPMKKKSSFLAHLKPKRAKAT